MSYILFWDNLVFLVVSSLALVFLGTVSNFHCKPNLPFYFFPCLPYPSLYKQTSIFIVFDFLLAYLPWTLKLWFRAPKSSQFVPTTPWASLIKAVVRANGCREPRPSGEQLQGSEPVVSHIFVRSGNIANVIYSVKINMQWC